MGLWLSQSTFARGGPPGGDNLSSVWRLVEYLHELNSRGVDWVVGGDWNMAFGDLDKAKWVNRVKGRMLQPSTTTCRKTLPGTIIDYHIISKGMMVQMSPGAQVDEVAHTWPHRPVRAALLCQPREVWIRALRQPRDLPRQPRPGCAPFPWDWSSTQRNIQQLSTREELAVAWDEVLGGIEFEVLNRHDVRGALRRQYVGRSGPVQMGWKKLRWTPARARVALTGEERAWIKAAAWAKHILRTHAYLTRSLLTLQTKDSFELRSRVIKCARELAAFHLHVCRNPHRKALDCWASEQFQVQMKVYELQGWEDGMNTIVEYGEAY